MKKFLFFAVILLIGSSVFAQQKYALIIGNGAYRYTTPLNNPVNDAGDVAGALRELGWTVDILSNASQEQMFNAVVRLKTRLAASRNSYGFFFYAGHGVQSNGENFLIPVDANIQTENFLRQMAVSVQLVLDELNDAGNELNVVVLDACRDNPYSWRRSGTRGLAVMSQRPADSIIVFATSAGSTAADGTGRNGLFTQHFLNHLRTPGIEVNEVFRRTNGDVARASNNQQRPEIYNQFYELGYLGTRPAAQPSVTPTPAPAVVQPSAATTAPSGFVQIQGGTFLMGSPANEAGRQGFETQRQVTVSSFVMRVNPVTVGEFRRFVTANRYRTEAERGDGGDIWTGSQWVRRSNADWRNPNFTQTDNHPVVLVSWNDAIQYCNWLSTQEGLTPVYTINRTNVTWNRNASGYRLPTEAEWEYACRGGTTTAYNTGANITTNQANFNNTLQGTTSVGNYAANQYGLHDMHGNVAEWCWDWHGAYLTGAQTNPAGASVSSHRVLRGGCWLSEIEYTRSALREGDTPANRSSIVGFRIVRNASGVTYTQAEAR
ncbi:MAG: SUMF1/EgtB/PvdO family nonheme iron enzyme [Treponema sp.]|nr:SUMF1/EgtB/PvdO family nonheme iron enzyme [Treponema sp.]